MLIHFFRGPGRIFGATRNADGANLPGRFAPWRKFKTIELTREGDKVPGVDTQDCLDDIEKYGFHVTDAHLRITPRAIGPA